MSKKKKVIIWCIVIAALLCVECYVYFAKSDLEKFDEVLRDIGENKRQLSIDECFKILTAYKLDSLGYDALLVSVDVFNKVFEKDPIKSYNLLSECSKKRIKNYENCQANYNFLDPFMRVAKIKTPVCGVEKGKVVFLLSNRVNQYVLAYTFDQDKGWSNVRNCFFDDSEVEFDNLTKDEVDSLNFDKFKDKPIANAYSDDYLLSIKTDGEKIVIENAAEFLYKCKYQVLNNELQYLEVGKFAR